MTVSSADRRERPRQRRLMHRRNCHFYATHRDPRTINLFLLLATVATTTVLQMEVQVVLGQLDVGGYMDTDDYQSCYDAMLASDEDGNDRLDPDEYAQFSSLSSPPGLLAPEDGASSLSFEDLPLEYQRSFLSIACLCSIPSYGGTANNNDDGGGSASGSIVDTVEVVLPPPDSDSCCGEGMAHVRIPAGPLEEFSLADRAYLYAACSYTQSAAESVLENGGDNKDDEPPSAPTAEQPSPAGSLPHRPSPPTSYPVAATNPPEEGEDDVPSPAPFPEPVSTATESPVRQFPPTSPVLPNVIGNITSPGPLPSSSIGVANVTYQIVVQQQADPNNSTQLLDVVGYLSDLQVSMNRLAPVVAEEMFDGRRRRKRRLRRRRRRERRRLESTRTYVRRSLDAGVNGDGISVTVRLPTGFGKLSDIGTFL